AHLLCRTGTDRRENQDAVVAKTDGFRRDVALPAAKLTRVRRHSAGPYRLHRIPRDARGDAVILELQDLQHFARALVAGAGNGREAPGERDRWTVDRGRICDDVVDVDNRAATDREGIRDVGDAVEPDRHDVGAGAVRLSQL